MNARRWAVAAGGALALAGPPASPAAAAPPAPKPNAEAPALSSTAYDRVQLFYTAADGTLIERHRTGTGGWTVAEGLGGNLVTGPAAATIGSEFAVTYAFGVGTDRQVWYRSYGDGVGAWGPWRLFGGSTDVEPAVSCTGDFTAPPTVYVRGSDGALWRKAGVAGAWTRLGGRLATAPAAAPAIGGVCPAAQDVVTLGTNGAVYEYRNGAWTSLGGYSDVTPSVVRLPGGATEAYLVGRNGALYVDRRASDAAAWSGWRKIGGGLDSSVAVQLRGTTRVVVGLGRDERYWQATSPLGSSTWTWTPLP